MEVVDRPVFVCGAPRSGTTLVASLLDGHESTLVLPFEPVITERYNRYRRIGTDAVLDYFLREYPENHGVQSIVNERYQEFLRARVSRRFGEHGEVPRVAEVDAETAAAFKRTYRQVLWEVVRRDGELSLAAPHRALMAAYVELVEKDASVIVQRRPFVNEAQAPRLKRAFPEAKFVHILRDPRTRYLSAKKRMTYRNRFGVRRIRNVSELDSATHRAVVSMASFELARRNREIMSTDYLVIRYEDLLDERVDVMQRVCDFLGIVFDEMVLSPTRGGRPTSPNSSFKESAAELARAAPDRLSSFYSDTGTVEQRVVHYYCARPAAEFGYDLPEEPGQSSGWGLRPIKHEHPLDYIRNRLGSLRGKAENRLHIANRHLERLLQGIERGEVPRM